MIGTLLIAFGLTACCESPLLFSGVQVTFEHDWEPGTYTVAYATDYQSGEESMYLSETESMGGNWRVDEPHLEGPITYLIWMNLSEIGPVDIEMLYQSDDGDAPILLGSKTFDPEYSTENADARCNAHSSAEVEMYLTLPEVR